MTVTYLKPDSGVAISNGARAFQSQPEENIQRMKKLLLLFAFAGLLNCKSDNQTYSIAPKGIVDRYIVTAYIVGGDTLFATSGIGYYYGLTPPGPNINKVGISSFAINIEAAEAGFLFTYSYYRDGLTPKVTRAIKPYTLSDYYTGFSLLKDVPGVSYEGKQRGSTREFSERTIGGGIAIPLVGLPGSPNPMTTAKEVIIVAKPQG